MNSSPSFTERRFGISLQGPLRFVGWGILAAVAVVATVATAIYEGRPHPLVLKVPEIRGHGGGGGLNMARIEAGIRRLASVKSRVTGYPGNRRAVEYIERELKRAGIREIFEQEFTTPVPIVDTAELRAETPGGRVCLPLHPLWPNLVRTSQTPPEGLTGPLIDVGKGRDADLAGKDVRHAVAVVDWDSRNEWLNLPEFGVRAVLFRANAGGNTSTARSKYLTVPGNVPRFYVTRADLPVLDRLARMRPPPRVTIHCRMAWRSVTGRNILARVPTEGAASSEPEKGDAKNAGAVIFQAGYDSISTVPDLSPGAEQACGASLLLELARFFRGKPTHRPVYVLFTGGHGEAFSGMIRFVRLLRDGLDRGWPKALADSLPARMGKPALFVGLDISSHSDRFGVFCCGRFRGQYESRLRPRFSTLGLKLAQYARTHTARAGDGEDISQFVDCINLTLGRGWWTYFPYQAPFESEVPTLAGFPGITLSTINDARRLVDTPEDRVDQLDFARLGRQLLHVPGRRIGIANLCLALATWQGPFVSRPLPNRMAKLGGRVVWLDQERDYTPNEPLRHALVVLKTMRGDKYLCGTRGEPVAMTDDQGRFMFDGLIESMANWQFENCMVEAYGMACRDFVDANPEAVREYRKVREARGGSSGLSLNGDIIYALDMARQQEYPWTMRVRKPEQYLNLVCFPCKAVTLYGLTDPQEYVDLKDVQILDAATESPPFQYGHSSTDAAWGNPEENCVTVWADPTLRVRITLGFGFQKKRLILIHNSPADPVGNGFVLEDLATIPSMVLQGTRDMWNLDEWRLAKFREQGIRNPRVEQLHAEARRNLDESERALSSFDYRTYRSRAEIAWGLEGKAYGELLGMTNNMIRGVLFYLALLLPFAYCLERLLFAGGTIQRRIAGMALIFVAGFIVLAVVHPAFRFTLTPLIVLLAFLILALGGTVTALILSRFDGALRERKQALTGFHEEEGKVGDIVMRAVDLGIANIRRRKQRGFLTGMTIVAVMFTLSSFVSIVPELNISKLRHPDGVPAPHRLLARSRSWAPMRLPELESVRRTYAASEGRAARGITAARLWYFSDLTGSLSQIDLSVGRAQKGDHSGLFTAVALLGMEASEPRVTGVAGALVAGHWFRNDDTPAIILPMHIAKCLGLGPKDLGTPILVFGEKLPLIGLLDEKAFDAIRDIDGEALTPVNFVLQQQIMAERASTEEKADTLENYVHYPVDQVALVSFGFARQIGATLRSIAIRTAPGVPALAEGEAFARRSNQTILASDGKEVVLMASRAGSGLKYAGQIVVPILLGFLMVLGTMLGSVFERKREIFVYNSVGLSPTHVAWLFFAEAMVYAVVGASLGYLIGQVVSKLLLVTGALSGLSLNYSAGATVFVTILTMLIVVSSTMYPARQAFLAAIPESRSTGIETEGLGAAADRISSFLPFVTTEANIYAMQAYMHEYFDGLQGVTVGKLGIDDLRAVLEEREGKPCPTLYFRAWLAPFDLGISHDVALRVVFRPDRGVYQFHIAATRFSGDQQGWRRLTPGFLLMLRKQLLMWRILPGDMQKDYDRRGRGIFGIAPSAARTEVGPAIPAAE